jgi:hypothetical protein
MGPLMGAARAAATDPTIELTINLSSSATILVLPVPPPLAPQPARPAALQSGAVFDDPVDALVARVPLAGRAVDALQVAATLEAEGVTDRAAKVEYGYRDVFALAERVFERRNSVVEQSPARRVARWRPAHPQALREISHGVLYLMPCAVFPAVLELLDRRQLVLGLVLGGGLGWAWAGGASWLAYQVLGRGHPRWAGRVLWVATLSGPPAALLSGTLVVLASGGGYGPVGLAAGQLAYQMASTVLMFYRREGWLVVIMAPAVLTGLAFLVAGAPVRPWAVATGAGGVAVAFAAALHHAGRAARADSGGTPLTTALGGQLSALPWVLAYGVFSAAYLLHAQVPYVLDEWTVVLGAVPLFVGMGVVEWRARRFTEQTRELLGRVRYPRQFVTRVWLLLAAGVVTCMSTVALVAVPLLAALRHAGLLSPAVLAMTAAHTVLAGAYFLSFILAGQGRYGWLCAALGTSAAVHLAAVGLVAGWLGVAASRPLADTLAFLGSAVLLQMLCVAALAPVVGQVRRYR